MLITPNHRNLKTTRSQRLSQAPKNEVADSVTLGGSFLDNQHENIVGIAGLAGMVGAGALVGTQLSGSFEGFTGLLVGAAAGAGAGAVAGLGVGEAFLHIYPLDPANEKEKYTALARGAAGMVGAMIGGVAGAVAGYCGAEPFSVAASSVLGGATSAGLTNLGLNAASRE